MPFTRTDQGSSTRITCEGKTLPEVFLNAGHGLIDVFAGGSKIRGDVRQEIVIQTETISSLFLEWLKELITRITQMNMVYSDFEVFSIQKAGAKQFVLTGAIYGEAYDASRHTLATSVALDEKSVTCKEGSDTNVCSFTLSH